MGKGLAYLVALVSIIGFIDIPGGRTVPGVPGNLLAYSSSDVLDQGKPSDPDPPDGVTLETTWTALSWQPGDFAVSHDVYFGTDPEAVRAATRSDADVYVGRQTTPRLFIGTAGAPLPEGLTPGVTYYWRIDEVNVANPASPWKGDLWSFYVPPLTAWDPVPPSGMTSVDPNLELQWKPGVGAILHTIYIGQDFRQISRASTGGTMTARVTYPPDSLKPNITYYWRVDEFQFPQNVTHRGQVWTFTTANSLIVDDFESYTNDAESYGRIFQTWIDGEGYTNPVAVPGNGSCAYVGHDIWTEGTPYADLVETKIVRPGGAQSMPLYYNNNRFPFYSMATRSWTTDQNWTVGGLDTLILYFYGRADNGLDSLYVMLEDSAGRSAMVTHPDPGAVRATRWIQWNIPLSGFIGTDTARVRVMSIGIGNPNRLPPGGSGLVYIDDIRIAKTTFIE